MRIAATIPTLNEATAAPVLVQRLLATGFDEVIVADGGSADQTRERCRAAGAKVVEAPLGRGAQLAAGAAGSTAEVLFFVHADSVPPPDAPRLICSALERCDVVGGTFRLRFDHDHPLLRLYAAASRLNATLFTYGDQGLFVRCEVYQTIGGFRRWPLFEDVEIQKRLRRAGRFVKLREPMTTSARRFLRDGLVRRQLKNAVILARFYAGGCPFELSRDYRPHKGG